MIINYTHNYFKHSELCYDKLIFCADNNFCLFWKNIIVYLIIIKCWLFKENNINSLWLKIMNLAM